MGPARLYGRGVSFPFRIDPATGGVAWSEGEQNVRECIEHILRTERDERVHLGELGAGLQSFLYSPNTVLTRARICERVERALDAWEPRIQVRSVTAEPDSGDPSGVTLTLVWQLRATGATSSLRYPLRLTG